MTESSSVIIVTFFRIRTICSNVGANLHLSSASRASLIPCKHASTVSYNFNSQGSSLEYMITTVLANASGCFLT